jgi:hypothetical protein
VLPIRLAGWKRSAARSEDEVGPAAISLDGPQFAEIPSEFESTKVAIIDG